jgi:thiol-disulfide isomerase/thioredoxin
VHHALIAAATAVVLAAGCSKPGEEQGSGEGLSRVNAVTKTASAPADPADLCDHMPAADKAPRLELPALAGELGEAKGWRWINLWATWCAPCVEELPLLMDWERRLGAAGAPVELTLISADESDEVVAAFRAKHPGTPEGPRLEKPEELGAWLEAIGLPGASLPVHLIVDPDQKIRCLRGSAVGKGDFDAARALLVGGP